MDSTYEHNYALQQKGNFSATDLEANKAGKFSPAQLKRFEEERDFIKQTSKKYDNKGWLISLIFGIGALFFGVVLYFVGVFDILQESLGALFFPVLCVIGIIVAVLVIFVIPRQYQSTVEMYNAMGTSIAENPLGEIQTIEARAETRKSQGGINRRGHQSSKISYVLTMDSIEFLISESLFEIIQPKRLYRVFAVKDGGVWVLLSMETLE
ncbi:MAG TPA: hypothetical protein DIW23_09470 [Anaerolineae bacterium]|nr:hypothetical protein [Anaerolineae bacterium]HCR71661.1 hypothetical protein [Anaerolineae bacterium]